MYPTITTNPNNGNLIFTVECSITDPIAECLWNALKIEKQKQLDISTQHKPVEDFTVAGFPITIIEKPAPVMEIAKPVVVAEKVNDAIVPPIANLPEPTLIQEPIANEPKPKRQRRSRKEMAELKSIKDAQTKIIAAPIIPIVKPDAPAESLIFTPGNQKIQPDADPEEYTAPQAYVAPEANSTAGYLAPINNTITETPPATEEPIINDEPNIHVPSDIANDETPKHTYDKEALDIMIKGFKVDAVKFVKRMSGMDLASAKTYCDELWTEYIMVKED